MIKRFILETDGQDLIEYAMLAAIVALGVVVGMRGVRSALQAQFTAISTSVAS